MFAILACPRSGTHFTAHFLTDLGFDIGHERAGKDGFIEWEAVFWTKQNVKNLSRLGYKQKDSVKGLCLTDFKPRFHQIRHPLDTINSMYTLDEKLFDYPKLFLPIKDDDSKLLQCMKWWYYWNLRAIHSSCFTYRVENIRNEVEKIYEILNRKKDSSINEKKIKKAEREHIRVCSFALREEYGKFNWNDLKLEDEYLYNKIQFLAKKCGYVL